MTLLATAREQKARWPPLRSAWIGAAVGTGKAFPPAVSVISDDDYVVSD